MVCSIKTIYYVRDFLPEKSRFFLLNALVISHLQYSSVILNGISQNLISTLEKQLNWGIKACFNGHEMDSAQDLRITRRERLKSAPYLRPKKRKRLFLKKKFKFFFRNFIEFFFEKPKKWTEWRAGAR